MVCDTGYSPTVKPNPECFEQTKSPEFKTAYNIVYAIMLSIGHTTHILNVQDNEEPYSSSLQHPQRIHKQTLCIKEVVHHTKASLMG